MEDIVQRVFAIIFAVLVFFVMPIYMTYEKRDDISYALALKITSNFVNTVKSKGYLTSKMYADFVSELGVTDNTYEIKMEHRVKKYNPVIEVYEDNTQKLKDVLDYSKYSLGYETKEITTFDYDGQEKTYSTRDGYRFEISYKLGEIVYNEKQILEYLDQEVSGNETYLKMDKYEYESMDPNVIPNNPLLYKTDDGRAVYKMSVGDEFTVTIRNTNQTFASVLFDALTFNGIASDMPRVYINYGGQIKNQEYSEFLETN